MLPDDEFIEDGSDESDEAPEAPKTNDRNSRTDAPRSDGGGHDRNQERGGTHHFEARPRAKSVKELLLDTVPHRSESAGEKLHVHLMGKVLVKFSDAPEKYMVDWSGNKLSSETSDQENGDCTITMSEKDMMRVYMGELNPQIAMLSHRVKVEGKIGHAIYFFNLIAPQAH